MADLVEVEGLAVVALVVVVVVAAAAVVDVVLLHGAPSTVS